MNKWYQWLYLSLCFAIGGIVNYLEGRQTIAAVVQVSITLAFAFIQLFCDRRGEKGKKAFRLISMSVSILLVIWLISLVLDLR